VAVSMQRVEGEGASSTCLALVVPVRTHTHVDLPRIITLGGQGAAGGGGRGAPALGVQHQSLRVGAGRKQGHAPVTPTPAHRTNAPPTTTTAMGPRKLKTHGEVSGVEVAHPGCTEELAAAVLTRTPAGNTQHHEGMPSVRARAIARPAPHTPTIPRLHA
jgi:hypothetical protein